MRAMHLLFICFSIVFFSCEKNNESIDDDILVANWKLDSAYFKSENEVKRYPDSLEKGVSIEFTDSSISILNGYCNKGVADYFLKEENITFSNVSMSELICLDGGGIWENYLYELNNVASYKTEDSKLTLISEGNIDLIFSKQME